MSTAPENIAGELLEERRRRRALESMRDRLVEQLAALRATIEGVANEGAFFQHMAIALADRYADAIRERDEALASLPAARWQRAWHTDPAPGTAAIWFDADLADLRQSIVFDADWYRLSNSDVAAAGIDPAVHYLLHGAAERRDPGPWFSVRQYLSNNPDVAATGANAVLHYIRHGAREGRTPFPAPRVAPLRIEAAAPSHARRRCLFVTGEPDSAGHHYRVAMYAEAARSGGFTADVVRADELTANAGGFSGYGLAIFWRVAWTDQVEMRLKTLREEGTVIVFDVDDLMTDPGLATLETIDGIRTQGLTEDGVRAHYERVRQTMLAADACFTTTDELARYLRAAGKVTHVLPNGFDRTTFDLSKLERTRWLARRDDLVRIGYAGGSRTHQRDFALAAEAVARVLRENPQCRLVLFRRPDGPLTDPAEFEALDGLSGQIEWRHAVDVRDLPGEMARFDVNLAPLEFGNPYCEAKSELKFFEAALAGVPTIASPTGPFRRAITHGVNGYLAASGDDWFRHLTDLITDGALRQRIGNAADRAALAKYGPMARTLSFTLAADAALGGREGERAFALSAAFARQERPPPPVFPVTVLFEQPPKAQAAVTVVVPLFNYQDHIGATLDSVAAQELELLDLVVVDGGSSDASLDRAVDWARRHAARFNRIVVMRDDANYGLGYCRNNGIDAAQTAYVVLLDADNLLLPDACGALVAAADASGAAFVYPTIRQFGASEELMGALPYDPQRLAAGNYIDAMALVSKEAWAIVGGIGHVRFGWEDYDFWCRLAERGLPGKWLDRTLALYRVHPASMQTTQTKVAENHRTLLADFKARHPWVSLIGQEEIRRFPAAMPLTAASSVTRLDTIMPLLRCPKTGSPLGYRGDRQALRSVDGLFEWPIRFGRPYLSPLVLGSEAQPEEHVSNHLPAAVEEIIASTPGWLLNLSAGGTAIRHERVVELEFSAFRHTDVVGDAHHLPFANDTFSAIVVLNAFEHYRDPDQVAREINRVLMPGGKLLVATAFLQPLHEAPFHFYNCTRYGLEQWFNCFETESITVTDNFSPNFTLGWVAAEASAAVRDEFGIDAAEKFAASPLSLFIDGYTDVTKRDVRSWNDLHRLSQPRQEIIAAGFQLLASKPRSPRIELS